MAGVFESFLAGQQAGQEQRTKRTLAEFVQPALGGDQSALAKVYAADPSAGLQVQGLSQKQSAADQEQKMGQLELAARAWRAADPTMRQQLYPSIAELTEAVLPQFAGKIPREYSPQYDANIDKFLSGFAGQEEQFTLAPGSARYDATGRVVASQPFAPERQDFQLSPDGTQWLPKPMGGAANLGPAIDMSGIGSSLDTLAGLPGVTQTSRLRTPERNAAVGGQPNSQHLRGTAGDYVVPQEKKAEFIQRAQAMGLTAIDEGDHIHVQGPRGDRQQAPSNGGAIPIPGARPRESEETFSQPQVVTNPKTGKQELVQFGNRGSRRLVTDYAPGPTDRDAKPPTEGERRAATLLSRLEFSEKQLKEAVESNKSAASPGVAASIAGSIPFVGDQARNFANSSERQRVEAAQLDILDAALTLGTGAAYTKEQLRGYAQSYFPQLGDSQATIDDKAARLQNVIDSARIAAGRAVQQGGNQSAAPQQAAPVQRARNPKTGQIIELRNGQWVPVNG